MDSYNTRRIIYWFLILTLIVILNYLSIRKFKRFSLNKGFILQRSRIDKNEDFELQNSTPRSISKWEIFENRIIQRSNRTRSYYHSKEEIELTKTFKIQPKQCNSNDTGISIFIPIRANGFAKRELLRSTWVKYAKQIGVCVYFLIALDPSEDIQEKNRIEAKEHQDIIQCNFIDDYYNLTLKSISLLRWANTHCKQDQFIIKVDDDIIYKIDWFLKNRQKFTKGIYGLMNKMGKIRPRNKKDSFYGVLRHFKFVCGPLYLITVNVIEALVKGIDTFDGYVIDIEDKFITGMLAEKLHIKRMPLITSIKHCDESCSLFHSVIICAVDLMFMKMCWDQFENNTFPKY